MKIRIIAGHCLGNARDVFPGDVLELEDGLAERKIRNGWAVVAKPEEPITFRLNPPPLDILPELPAAAAAPELEPAGASGEAAGAAPPAPSESSSGGGRGRSSKN
jgi:hypothetical protein